MNSNDYNASPTPALCVADELADECDAGDGLAGAVRMQVPVAHAGLRLDQALARLLPQHSRSRLQAWLRAGQVCIDGQVITDARRKVWGGEWLDVRPLAADPQQLPAVAENIPLQICHEDEAILVINKPAGLVVHPGSGNWQGTLLNALLHHAPALAAIPRAGIVHRLDKDTSGLLVVAKTLEAQTELIRQLQARTVERHYLALVHGLVRLGGIVDAPIGRHPTQRTRMAVVPLERHGKEARTHYLVREQFADVSLLECRLETGRTHQIRVHMMTLGHPLVGEPVYGRGQRSVLPALRAFPRQALHAWRLALRHPASQQEMDWETPLPEDFAALLAQLRTQKAGVA